MKNPVYSLPVKTKRLVEIRKRKNELRQILEDVANRKKASGRYSRQEFKSLYEEEKLLILRTVAGSPYSEPIYSIDDASMKRVMSSPPFGISLHGGLRLARTRK